MKVVVQRVRQASVTVGGRSVGSIRKGLLLLVGLKRGDTIEDVVYAADKIAVLRLFDDETGKMNRSILDVGGTILSVSQFTLYGDVSRGRRPSFMEAARPEEAQPLYQAFNQQLRTHGLSVETGVFGAIMEVSLVNDGPVTFIVESRR